MLANADVACLAPTSDRHVLNLSTVTILIDPIFSSYYNEMINSEERATLLSVASVLFSAVMVIAFPLFGWLIQINGFSFAFGLVGCVLVVVLIVMRRSFVSPK